MFINTNVSSPTLRADVEEKFLSALGQNSYDSIYAREIKALEPRLAAFQLLLPQDGVPAALTGAELYRNYTVANRRLLTATPVIFPHDDVFIKALDEDGDQAVKWLAFEPSNKHPYRLHGKPISYYFIIRDFPEEERFATFLAIGLTPEVYTPLQEGMNQNNPAARAAIENLDQLLAMGNHDWLHACMLNIRQSYGNKKCFSYPSLLRDHYKEPWKDLPQFLPSDQNFKEAGIATAPVEAFSYELAFEIWAKRFSIAPEEKKGVLNLLTNCVENSLQIFSDKDQCTYYLALAATFGGQIFSLVDPQIKTAIERALGASEIYSL